MIKMEVESAKLEQILKKMPLVLKMEVGDALDHAGRKFLSEFAKRRLKAPVWFQSDPSQGTVENRGGFFRGFKRIFTSSDSSMGTVIFTESKIAKTQEKGGTVSSSKGIPVPLSAVASENMTPKGRVKKSLWNLERNKNIRPIKFKGQVYLTKVFKNPNIPIVPLFVIKPSVDLKPRLEFVGTFKDMEQTLLGIVRRGVSKGVERAWEHG